MIRKAEVSSDTATDRYRPRVESKPRWTNRWTRLITSVMITESFIVSVENIGRFFFLCTVESFGLHRKIHADKRIIRNILYY